MKRIPLHIYIIVFLITLCVVCAALYASIAINSAKTERIKDDEDKIAIDIFALETKTDLFKESDCEKINTDSVAGELSDLSARIDFMEKQVSANDQTIFRLKRYFGLLQIKNYLVNQKIAKQCGITIPTIIYFYEQNSTCSQCAQEEYALGAIRQTQPQVNIYSFDYENDISALRAYTSIQSLPEKLPFLIVNGTTHEGFTSLDALKKLIQQKNATSTKS